MYLSRVKLDLKRSETKRAVSSPQVLHGIIEGCYTEKNRTLWRLDALKGDLYLLLVSELLPNFENLSSQLCEEGETWQTKNYKAYLDKIKKGQEFRFRFRGNPVHSIMTEKGMRGKVVPHVGESHKKEWLIKKSTQNGFSVTEDSFSIVETGVQQFYKKEKSKPIRLSHTVFEGVLSVTDEELFVEALSRGIGRGKAYGCGLLTVMELK